jgi:hypothetical protein
MYVMAVLGSGFELDPAELDVKRDGNNKGCDLGVAVATLMAPLRITRLLHQERLVYGCFQTAEVVTASWFI